MLSDTEAVDRARQEVRNLARCGPFRTLLAHGIEGEINDPERCPVALYLHERLDGRGVWVMQTGTVEVESVDDRPRRSESDKGYAEVLTFDLPREVEQFVQGFDAGGYPSLVSS